MNASISGAWRQLGNSKSTRALFVDISRVLSQNHSNLAARLPMITLIEWCQKLGEAFDVELDWANDPYLLRSETQKQ